MCALRQVARSLSDMRVNCVPITSTSPAVGRSIPDGAPGNTTDYLYDGVNVVQEKVSGTATANMLTGGVDQVFSRTESAGTQSVVADGLGSTLALLNPTGGTETDYTYEPFGNTSSGGAASSNPSQYTGRENDGTGLYYYRARYYSPKLQRFISEDGGTVIQQMTAEPISDSYDRDRSRRRYRQ